MEQRLARVPLDLPFLMLVLMLVGIGLIVMFSASYASAYYSDKITSPLFYIRKQALYAGLGVVIMFAVSKFNYQYLRGLSPILLIISVVLLVLVLTPLGVANKGALR